MKNGQNLTNTTGLEKPLSTERINNPLSNNRKSTKGKKRKVRVSRDGREIIVIDGVVKTFEWARVNQICNQGWVKRSLKNQEATKPGFKFKDAGYLFEYAD